MGKGKAGWEGWGLVVEKQYFQGDDDGDGVEVEDD